MRPLERALLKLMALGVAALLMERFGQDFTLVRDIKDLVDRMNKEEPRG